MKNVFHEDRTMAQDHTQDALEEGLHATEFTDEFVTLLNSTAVREIAKLQNVSAAERASGGASAATKRALASPLGTRSGRRRRSTRKPKFGE